MGGKKALLEAFIWLYGRPTTSGNLKWVRAVLSGVSPGPLCVDEGCAAQANFDKHRVPLDDILRRARRRSRPVPSQGRFPACGHATACGSI